MECFELIIIGGGPGGYLCAELASAAGLSTALIEKRALGGTCLNEGCVPTKTILNSAKLYRHALDSAPFGVTVEGAKLDHAKVIARKNDVVRTLVSGVAGTLKRNKVTVLTGDAEIQGRDAEGFHVTVNGEAVTGRRLVLATGSETTVPPIPGLHEGLESGFAITNREALANEQLPKTMVVMGGGVIGLEMVAYYVSAGVQVTVVEMLPKIAGPMDDEASDVLLKEYTKQGVTFKLSTRVTAIEPGKVVYEKDGKSESIACDQVLLSLGRRPVVTGFGLEKLNVEFDKGGIKTDDRLRTSVPGVYAIGDCNGVSMLAHTAYREAEALVNNLTGKEDHVVYHSIPSVIYTDPEVAAVGETKRSAEEKGMSVREIKLPLLYSGRYVAENINGKGFIKLVVDTDRNRLVGVHMLGSYASEIIASAGMMVDQELPPERLKKFVFPHPTVGEVLHNALNEI